MVDVFRAGPGASEIADEDEACARYIAARIRDTPTDVAAIVASLWKDEDPNWPDWFPRRDAELACQSIASTSRCPSRVRMAY